MQNWIYAGKTAPYTATNAVQGGQLVVLPAMVGVAIADIEAGEEGNLETEGVFELPKETPTAVIEPYSEVFVTPDGKISATQNDKIELLRVGVAWGGEVYDPANVRVKINV